MADDPAPKLIVAIAELIGLLERAKLSHQAALLDERDRRADESLAHDRTLRAERHAGYAKERVDNARNALHMRLESLTDTELEPELDPDKITGPEERDLT